jgi:hypothetical protein
VDIEFGRVVDALAVRVWTALLSDRGDYLNQSWCEYARLLPKGTGATFASSIPRAHASAANVKSPSGTQTTAPVDALRGVRRF